MSLRTRLIGFARPRIAEPRFEPAVLGRAARARDSRSIDCPDAQAGVRSKRLRRVRFLWFQQDKGGQTTIGGKCDGSAASDGSGDGREHGNRRYWFSDITCSAVSAAPMKHEAADRSTYRRDLIAYQRKRDAHRPMNNLPCAVMQRSWPRLRGHMAFYLSPRPCGHSIGQPTSPVLASRSPITDIRQTAQ